MHNLWDGVLVAEGIERIFGLTGPTRANWHAYRQARLPAALYRLPPKDLGIRQACPDNENQRNEGFAACRLDRRYRVRGNET